MIALRLTLRYLKTRRIAIVAAFCMAAAVCAMVVITAVMDGFRATIHKQLRGVEADLSLTLEHPPEEHGIAVETLLSGEMAAQGGPIEALAPRLESFGLLWSQVSADASGRSLTRKAGVRIIGIDFAREAKVLGLQPMMARPRPSMRSPDDLGDDPLNGPIPRILIGRRLADELELFPVARERAFGTSRITLMTGRRVIGSRGEEEIEPQSAHFDVLGTFETDRVDFDTQNVFIDRFALHELRYGRGGGQPLASKVTARLVPAEAGSVEAIAKRLRAGYPSLRAESWRDRNGDLLAALDIEKTTVSVVLALIVLITTSLIMGLLYLLVLEKTRDIGALRSMGMTGAQIVSVFVSYAGLLGFFGAGLGTLAGVWAVKSLDQITAWSARNLGFEVFSAEVDYSFHHLPAILDNTQVATIGILGWGLAVLAGALAAWRASRLDPIQCLRNE